MSSDLGFSLGCKVVRGAYLETERLRAKQLGIASPILSSYEKTNANYDRVVGHLIRDTGRMNDFILVATHNRDSVLKAVEAIGGDAPDSRRVHFAQINGMGDHLTLGLARGGFSALKLVPCGSVSQVLPWLARRIQENGTAMKRNDTELALIKEEIKQRILKS